jgi:hypothetical protein
MHLALQLAACTDQVVFGPLLAARAQLDAGLLVEVPVEGWDVRRPLFLLCNADRVLASELKHIVPALQEALGQSAAGEVTRREGLRTPAEPPRGAWRRIASGRAGYFESTLTVLSLSSLKKMS